MQELASAIGVHPVTVSKWLHGRQRPTGSRARLYSGIIALLASDETWPIYDHEARWRRAGEDAGR